MFFQLANIKELTSETADPAVTRLQFDDVLAPFNLDSDTYMQYFNHVINYEQYENPTKTCHKVCGMEAFPSFSTSSVGSKPMSAAKSSPEAEPTPDPQEAAADAQEAAVDATAGVDGEDEEGDIEAALAQDAQDMVNHILEAEELNELIESASGPARPTTPQPSAESSSTNSSNSKRSRSDSSKPSPASSAPTKKTVSPTDSPQKKSLF